MDQTNINQYDYETNESNYSSDNETVGRTPSSIGTSTDSDNLDGIDVKTLVISSVCLSVGFIVFVVHVCCWIQMSCCHTSRRTKSAVVSSRDPRPAVTKSAVKKSTVTKSTVTKPDQVSRKQEKATKQITKQPPKAPEEDSSTLNESKATRTEVETRISSMARVFSSFLKRIPRIRVTMPSLEARRIRTLRQEEEEGTEKAVEDTSPKKLQSSPRVPLKVPKRGRHGGKKHGAKIHKRSTAAAVHKRPTAVINVGTKKTKPGDVEEDMDMKRYVEDDLVQQTDEELQQADTDDTNISIDEPFDADFDATDIVDDYHNY